MIDSVSVIEKLSENIDSVIEILEDFGFANINAQNQKEIRCSYESDSNPTGVRILKENLYSTVYSRNIRGDFYKLLMTKSNSKFIDIHNILISKLEGVTFEIKKPTKKLFDGLFDDDNEIEYKILSESTLEKYERVNNLRFYKDNIFLSTQNEFELYYDNLSNRIVIPWRNEYGCLVGCTGRLNYETLNENVPKYIAMDKFKKSNHLYGINKAIDFIINSDLCIIVESEKSVMKAHQMGFPFTVAVGSHSISKQQVEILKKYCSNIIVAFDEGLEEDEIIESCKALKDDFTVYYIFDNDNSYLPKDSKLSPLDLNMDDFKKIMNGKRKKIE